MQNIMFIWKREIASYFNSVVAFTVVDLFLLITGALFWLSFFSEINVLTMRGFFNQAPLFLAFFAPAITMGLIATEKRSGTLQLLMTMPVTEWQIVVGKFLAACTLLAVMFGCTLMYPLTLDRLGDLDWGATMAGYIGMMLLGGSYCAIGIMASSFTKDQVVSILVAFFLCFGLYLVDQLAGQPTGGVAYAFQYASTSYHFQNIARGVIDVRDVVYYLSLIVVCLYIARTVIASRRW